MRTQSVDTRLEAEQVLIELIRKAPLSKRLNLARSLTISALWSNQQNLRKLHPNISEAEIARLFVLHHYGQELANSFQIVSKKFKRNVSAIPDPLVPVKLILEALEQLKIAYYLYGSIATVAYGMQRALTNIEIAADLHFEHVTPLFEHLESNFYLDREAVHHAIQNHTSFSGVHLESLIKFDISLPKKRAFDQAVYYRAKAQKLMEDASPLYIASPEDIALIQLEQYKINGKISDDQWNDILGIFKVQAPSIDLAYLQQWATVLEVSTLLKKGFEDAGIKEK